MEYSKRMACAIAAMILSLAGAAMADVKLPSVIGDGMVLQRGREIPIWGKADPGEKVAVTLNGEDEDATTGDDGKWMVKLGKMKAGGPFEMTIKGKNAITLHDILIGEVWVCSGQSNMEWPVKMANEGDKEVAAANHPKLRLFTVKKNVVYEPQWDTEGKWMPCTPENIPGFTAVGYFFGREIQKALDVPVGLIHTSWGGTPAEAWTSREVLLADADLKPMVDRWDKFFAEYPQAKEGYDKALAQWKADSEKAKAEGKPAPRQPGAPAGPGNPGSPAGLYNGMITPILPYAIAGAIWYQGESNAGRAYQYRKLFPAMIKCWREAWGQGEFPFYFVQLANFLDRKPDPAESAWAELREAQTMTLALPKTGMATIIDLGDAKDIHPKNKQDVGKRLALAALAKTYKQKIDYSGPTFDSMKIKENKIRIKFENTGDGLVARGGELKGFAVAGEDKKFVWAKAEIDGKSVVVSAESVANPVAVRYGWADNPDCNLYNKADLPASPFRTDDWPGVTVNER